MKYLAFLIIVFLASCSKPDKNLGYNKATKFVKEYSHEYFNSELHKYSYSPRIGYEYSKNDTFLFRVIYRRGKQDSNLLIIKLKEFNKVFSIINDSLINIQRGVLSINDNKYFLKGSEYFHSEIPVDTQQIIVTVKTDAEFTIPALQVRKNPIDYFKILEEKKKKYGILSVQKLRIGGLIKIYFTHNDYLIFYPDNFPLDKNEMDYWIKKKYKGKILDKNWYFYHDDKKIDFG